MQHLVFCSIAAAVLSGGVPLLRSLVMLSRAEQKCYHYDSSHSSNVEASQELHRRLNPIFDGLLTTHLSYCMQSE